MRRLRTTSLLSRATILAAGLCVSQAAWAYVGPSYLRIDGVNGGARDSGHRNWVRAEANYWDEQPVLPEIRGIRGIKNDLLFTGPVAPAQGPGMLSISVGKDSPAMGKLMELCRSGEALPKLVFAESSEAARHPQEHGPRPADVPAFYEYELTGVRLTCPVAPGAPEQAFGLRFEGIRWLNYKPQPAPRPVAARAAFNWIAPPQGKTRAFAVSWFAAALDANPGQCPKVNTKPSQADYFALLPEAEAAAERAKFADGGVGPDRMQFRGPGRMHATLMPGIVADPGIVSPVGDVAPGFDLDGDDGAHPPRGIRAHRNFRSPDGRMGIDNQLFTVEGCVEGFRRRGFLPMIFNEGRAAGRPTALIEVSGIDDERNDDEVWVSILYSADELRRSPAKTVLPDFTYRVTRDPAFAQDFARFRGRIADGVLTTEPIPSLHVHEVTGIETTLLQPRLRIEFRPDGGMKGTIGGYLDWRKRLIWEIFRASDYENTIGMQAPAMYNALKRAADALPDPATGEYRGISAAFDIEGVAAFLTSGEPAAPQVAALASKRNIRK